MNISIEELEALGPNGATIINAGAHSGSQEIRGAIRYRPNDLLTASHLALPIATDRPVVLYDERGSGEQLDEIAEKLRANGYPDVRILDGGFAAADAAHAPTQEASTEQIVPPTKPTEVQALDRRL
ncbi:MAG: rhodanese-like domain-containing protein [Candidatus Velthaea sp.]|jgi:3-mercaptopyruvate sulfurtransferase SseA